MGEDLQADLDRLGATIDANVRRLAKSSGLSMTALAEAAGISRSHLYAVLDGSKTPRVDTLLRLARTLGVPVWVLLKPDG